MVRGLNLDGERDARVLEQTFATAGFDAAVVRSARRQLEELDANARGSYVPAAHYVFAHVRTRNLEEAFAWLPKMARARLVRAANAGESDLDPLRSDPRFEKIAGSVVLK